MVAPVIAEDKQASQHRIQAILYRGKYRPTPSISSIEKRQANLFDEYKIPSTTP